MASLADDLLGEIRLRRAGGRVARYSGYGKARGRRSGAGGSSFSARTRNLWRVGQGSNAAVLKKIARGGTQTPVRLQAQLRYLFTKSHALFGNTVGLDPEAQVLSAEQRRAIVLDWSDGWRGDPKNGHTTHLLLSFPYDLAPKKALRIAEAWAFEMFQSGTHVQDEWAYVAALHTDRSHPHVHIVVNNRGLEQDTWFFMAKDHAFNLSTMKERLVEIAGGMGVELDASSRLERGILTYGPSRAEIEGAARERRPVRERALQGPALEEGLAVVSRSATTLRTLAGIASLARLQDVKLRMERAAAILETGGIVSAKTLEGEMMDVQNTDVPHTRRSLDRVFASWLDRVEGEIATLGPKDRRALREELAEVTTAILRDLGDARGADLVMRRPRSELYRTELDEDAIRQGTVTKALSRSAVQEVRSAVFEAAEAIGIERSAMERRLEHPAANAWQEREWVKADLKAVSAARGLNLDVKAERDQVVDIVDRFYATAATVLNRALEMEHAREAVHEREGDRLVRTLETLARVHRQHQRVEFEREDHAERFAQDLKERYGENVMEQIAGGDDRVLASDFPEPWQRREIARALVTAAESHESFGLSIRQAELARERLLTREHSRERPQHELRRKDHDLDL
ncbi:relaxase/mobilization nuclease domain-containing protein [Paracoccus sp. WLY502]|uniref:relaxase/mobilization nuclease domain-containing protein n=1 Tax=Paracoccus yibinensis TaxID=3068891 RepID=UPI00279668CF|nr:relaxase/mobilization nuclease domain-containing protein [Paracoccus sp. WLY502]MDQ1902794.1 relaxase/mobilization nuclease domain-containing protein [Paracoccus sp. WLY502]